MGEANFRLAAYTNSKGKSPIMLDFRWTVVSGTHNRLFYSTKCTIIRSHWNNKTQRPRTITGFEKEYKLISDHLDNFAQETRVIFKRYHVERRLLELTPERMRAELDNAFDIARSIKAKSTFFAWCEDYLTKIYPTDATFNEGTHKVLKTTIRHLKEFNSLLSDDLDFPQFNRHLYGQFVGYLRNNQGLADNTIEKIVFAGLKRFLNEAKEAGVNPFTAYQEVSPKKVGVQKTKGDKIYLTRSELRQIYGQPLPGHLERVRDTFVAAVFLGLRYGDWEKVRNENLINIGDGKKALSIILDKKPQPRVIIPCHPVVIEILNKYKGVLPVLSNQKMNGHLKEIGEAAGLTGSESKTIRKGRVIETKHSKFELLTCHVARNCFESSARRAGIPQRDIDLFTGHTSKEVSDIYDRRKLETVASDYSDHQFFTTWED